MSFTFTKLSVFPSPASGTYHVEWDGNGQAGSNYVFSVYWGPSEDGPWEYIKDAGAFNSTDIKVNFRSLTWDRPIWFYVEARKNGTKVGQSSPSFFDCRPTRDEFLRYREMLRRWNLELQKFDGSDGAVLRLRLFGEKAKNVHPILDQPIGVEDKDGLGQKFVGAYWPPIKMRYASAGATETKQPNTELGISEVSLSKIFTMPFPFVNSGDIWVDLSKGERHIVKNVDKIEVTGLPLKQIINLSRLPATDPAYKIPVT